jgi:hypothetical protein
VAGAVATLSGGLAAMKRPERIRILGKPFKIVYCSGTEPLADDQVGECDPDKQQILVRDGAPLESEQDTLLHEVLHALDEAVDAKLKETQVKKIATALLAVLKDNPGLAAFLRKK